MLTFTSDPLPAGLHVVGFPVVSLRLATSGSDGAIYAYLQDVAPNGEVTYVTEGCLRFVHRARTGPAKPSRLGVPRSFARANRLAVTPWQDLDLAVELLPVAALVRAGHKIRVALSGHDAACFDRYGAPDETFALHLGEHSTLDVPILTSRSVPIDLRSAAGQKHAAMRDLTARRTSIHLGMPDVRPSAGRCSPDS